MDNETDMLIYQKEDGNKKIDVRLENETVWMTQKAIADLYQTSTQNITLHIGNIIKFLEDQNSSRYYTVVKKEGARNIKRKILHYNLDIIYNIAIRGQYFEEFNRFMTFAKANRVNKNFITFVPIKEHKFCEMLKGSLKGIVDIYPQYRVNKYIVDFYIPQLELVIEYDEKHHVKQIMDDETRQKFIEGKLGVQFIRVNEGEEFNGLNRVFKFIMEKRLNYSNVKDGRNGK
ncbi:DUF559 domain-containing protein [Virgibacillus ihumii]|uniref:DUF559 domain-containing protein n=1 Tax=Virgibacillus ihumii TaxID=2686091 RepID=UPI00157D33D9|nr:DUF559 domain-containing protein [Virgibacillus ihumii]